MAYQQEIRVLQKNIRRLEEHLKKVNKDLYAAELAYDEARTKLGELEQTIVSEKLRYKVVPLLYFNYFENIKRLHKLNVADTGNWCWSPWVCLTLLSLRWVAPGAMLN